MLGNGEGNDTMKTEEEDDHRKGEFEGEESSGLVAGVNVCVIVWVLCGGSERGCGGRTHLADLQLPVAVVRVPPPPPPPPTLHTLVQC